MSPAGRSTRRTGPWRSCHGRRRRRPYRRLRRPRPLAVSFPKPEKLFLPNGLLIYLFEDHELPLIDLAFYVKAGSIYDPADRIGLAEMGALMMRTGGISDMSPDEVDQALESMPARVGFDASSDALSGSLST